MTILRGKVDAGVWVWILPLPRPRAMMGIGGMSYGTALADLVGVPEAGDKPPRYIDPVSDSRFFD